MTAASPPEQSAAPKRAKSAKVCPFEKSQLPYVVRLYEEVFGKEVAQNFADRWRWSQEENGFPAETRQWSLLDGSRLVGFLATVPQRFRVAGTETLVHSSCDFMVHPDYRFHGIALMREYFRACDNCVSLDDMPATIAVLKMMKAVPVENAMRYVRVLDGRVAKDRIARLASVPPIAFLPATVLLRAYDAARALALPKVEKVRDFDVRFDRFFASTMDARSISLVRDSTYLSWRYGPLSPHRTRTIGVVTDGQGEIDGYVVSATGESPEDRAGYIFELHVRPGAPPALTSALLTFACRQIRREGGHLARLHWLRGATGVAEPLLAANRFAKRTHEHVLLVKFKDAALQAAAVDGSRWDYGFGDAEASHSVAT
ncbi:MAG: GNAT family N-acetyltransferase [Polyangiaceae bacterium]